jgi:hypothetical protein
MPTDIRIIRAQEFVVANPEGRLDFKRAKTLLMEIASAKASSFNYEILLDTRKAQVELSVADLWYLAGELSNFGKVFSRKTAVLCPLERFDNAQFFALCAENRGSRVRAFTSFEDAFEWLIGN